MSRPHQHLGSRLRLAATRAVLVVAAVTILLGAVRAGTRYFYCPITHLAFESSPCSSPRSEADHSDDPAIRLADCCEERWRATPPIASRPDLEGPSVGPATLVAIQTRPRVETGLPSVDVPFALAHAVRAGPPPPSASRRRAQSMVFHI